MWPTLPFPGVATIPSAARGLANAWNLLTKPAILTHGVHGPSVRFQRITDSVIDRDVSFADISALFDCECTRATE
jgi:hypothetical protein